MYSVLLIPTYLSSGSNLGKSVNLKPEPEYLILFYFNYFYNIIEKKISPCPNSYFHSRNHQTKVILFLSSTLLFIKSLSSFVIALPLSLCFMFITIASCCLSIYFMGFGCCLFTFAIAIVVVIPILNFFWKWFIVITILLLLLLL